MSTHAIVTAENNPTLELYIHYDGYSQEMIQKIVNIARKNHARNLNYDEPYGMARLCCACEEYFKNQETGFGVNVYGQSDYDYHYIVDNDWFVKKV